jgi:hypothetical protein
LVRVRGKEMEGTKEKELELAKTMAMATGCA